MSDLNYNQHYIDSLELQTGQLFEAFKHAIATRAVTDGIYARGIYNLTDDHLRSMARTRTADIGREDDPLNRYFLLMSMMNEPTNFLSRGIKNTTQKTKGMTMDLIIGQIDNPATSYQQIGTLFGLLSGDGRYEDVSEAVKHVREDYPKPTLEQALHSA